MARAGQKLLDLVDYAIGVTEKRKMIDAGQLDILGFRHQSREIAPAFDAHATVTAAVHDQRRYADRWEDMADIDLAVHSRDCERRGGADAQPFQTGVVADKSLV